LCGDGQVTPCHQNLWATIKIMEHSPKGRWMVILECAKNVTFIVVPKKVMIMGQANHYMYLLENGLDMTI
jgi:hypothetical protein